MRRLAAAGLAVHGVAGILATDSARAQSIFDRRGAEPVAAVEWSKPNFRNGAGFSSLSSALFLGVRLPLGDGMTFVAELPLAHARASAFGFSESSTIAGNPYLGLDIGRRDAPVRWQIGLRAPLTPSGEPATAIGAFADLPCRFEAFLPRVVPVSFFGSFTNEDAASGVGYRIRGGPLAAFTTERDPGFQDVVELYLLYSATGWLETGGVAFSAGIGGRMIVTESGLDVAERTLHQAQLGIELDAGQLRPGVHLRLPLDRDLRDILSSVIGVGLAIRLD